MIDLSAGRMQLRFRVLMPALVLLATTAPLLAQKPWRQPPASEYVKILDDPHRIERMNPPEVVRTLGLKPGAIVADIGSGSGLFTRPMAQAVRPGGTVYAVDIDKELLAHVARTASEQGIHNIKTVLGENDSPTLAPASLDLALLCDTLHHIEHRATYLANLKPCLKPGGRLVIIDFSDGWPTGHESLQFTLADLDAWTTAAGYVKVAEYNFIEGNFFRIYKVKTGAE